MNRTPLFAALLLAAVSAGAETTALDQARAASAKGASGAENFDGCVGPTCATKADPPRAVIDPTKTGTLTVASLPEPKEAVKEPPTAACPPCPPEPWYKKPIVVGAGAAVVGALIGLALAPASLPTLGLIFGAAYGFMAGFALAKFLL